jgi:hypothetical protein
MEEFVLFLGKESSTKHRLCSTKRPRAQVSVTALKTTGL